MSYPPSRYAGEKGEINATFRPVTAGPDFVSAPGADPGAPESTAYHYLATTARPGGELGLYQVEMGPAAVGPSIHFHRTISESFYILSGTLRLFDGSRWIDATAGDFLHVPVGGLHAFHNESGQPVSMLMLFTPGAPREGYFEGLPEIGRLGEDERRQFFIDHDSYFVQDTD